MNITVIGSGYVGTTAAAFFSLSGHNVTALDIDKSKVDKINSGKAPFYEAGLDNLLTHAINADTLRATSEYSEAISNADVIFSCVGTPDNPDGSSNLDYIFQAAKDAASFMKDGVVYVQKSTVPVGTGKKVIELLPENTSYVSNPEFLRESTAIYDTIFFDRVVAGGDNTTALDTILGLHKDVEDHSETIAQIANLDSIDIKKIKNHVGDYIKTGLESAEMIKVTANAFLALKISFANSIAKLCDKTDADIQEVMSIVGGDLRIGKAFLNAGRGYGGGCFPKDVSGLISSGHNHGVDLEIMKSATSVNESMPEYIINKVADTYGDLKDVKVSILGLSFKSGTSDIRKSPSIKIANLLDKRGSQVKAYDPETIHEEVRQEMSNTITLSETLKEAVTGSAIVFIATDWNEFTNIKELSKLLEPKTLVVDCMNALNPPDVRALGFDYVGIGRS